MLLALHAITKMELQCNGLQRLRMYFSLIKWHVWDVPLFSYAPPLLANGSPFWQPGKVQRNCVETPKYLSDNSQSPCGFHRDFPKLTLDFTCMNLQTHDWDSIHFYVSRYNMSKLFLVVMSAILAIPQDYYVVQNNFSYFYIWYFQIRRTKYYRCAFNYFLH